MSIITDTQRAVLEAAARHPDGLAAPPAQLPPAPRGAVAKAMLRAGLLERAGAAGPDRHDLAWKLDGGAVLLRVIEAGLLAVGAAAEEGGNEAEGSPLAAPHASGPHTTHPAPLRPPRARPRAGTRASRAPAAMTPPRRPRRRLRAGRRAARTRRAPTPLRCAGRLSGAHGRWCANRMIGVGRLLSLSLRRRAATPAFRAGSSG
jgi:hypothetical protein